MARGKIKLTGRKPKKDAGNVGRPAQPPTAETPILEPAQPPGEDRAAAQPAARGYVPRASLNPADLEATRQRSREYAKRYKDRQREREQCREEKRAAKQAKPAPDDLKPKVSNSPTFSQGGVAKILFSVHYMAASFFHEQALALDDKESEQYAKAIMEFSAAWGHPELSDKALAALNLGGTMVMVYGPRLVVIARRQRQPKMPPIPPPSGNAYNDAARATQQAVVPQPKPQAAPPQTVARPNGFVQTVISPFGDQDGMAI